MKRSTDLGELQQLALETVVRLENQGLVRFGGVEHGPGGGDMGRRTVEITSGGWEALDASRVPPARMGEGEGPE